jgi:hypothetical protein
MIDAAAYCREIETYLCRKNEGHLVRIVGPAFEQVCGWAGRGVPLAVAFRGIDRCCERYHAKGPRRRPVRIEFCEADVLEAFDQWRRAVGVTAAIGGEAGADSGAPPRKPALAAHVERAAGRLAAVRASGACAGFEPALDAAGRELARLAEGARHARGSARAQIIERLAEIDRLVVDEAIGALGRDAADRIGREAAEEIAPFAGRMPPEARARATEAARRRLVRESLALPVIAFE